MRHRQRDRWAGWRSPWEERQARWQERLSRLERNRELRAGIRRLLLPLLALVGVTGMGWLVVPLVLLVVSLGLLSALLSSAVGVLIGAFLCLAPVAALLALGGLWIRERRRQASPAVGEAPAQESGKAVPAPGTDVAPPLRVEPDASRTQKVSPPSGAPPAPRPKATEVRKDPSYYRQRATGYRRRIQSIINNRRPGPLSDVLKQVVANLQSWEERVGQLADRLAAFEGDSIIQRDIREVPLEIERLRRRASLEADPELRQQMERTLRGYEEQQALLETLIRLMQRTRLHLEDTLAAMGTIYSQVRMLDAMDIDSAKTVRIADEVAEQVARLNDLLSALGEAYERPQGTDDLDDAARRIRLDRGGAAG